MVISDHSPVILQLKNVMPKGNYSLWRFPTHLTKDKKVLCSSPWVVARFPLHTQGHVTSPGLHWEKAKVVLRGHIMSYISRYKRKVNNKIQSLGQTLRQACTDFLANVTSETKFHWHNAKMAYDVWLKKEEGIRRSQQGARLLGLATRPEGCWPI